MVGHTGNVLNAFTGFFIIGVIITAGYLVARLRLVGEGAATVLNKMAFFVTMPALLFTVVSTAEVSLFFSWFALVAGVSALVTAGLYVVASRLWFRTSLPDTTMGAACSSYVNSNNIGLPVAAYVIGNAQYVVPQILVQVLVFSPVVLGVLDLSTKGRVRVRDVLAQPVRNPIVAATGAGAVVAVGGWTVPTMVSAPLAELGAAAVPMVLLAFGAALHGHRPLKAGTQRSAVLVATGLKVAVMPAVAFGLALALRLPDELVFALVITTALPTAQNMNNYAARYGRGQVLARDIVLLTTLVSVPVILALTAVFHH